MKASRRRCKVFGKRITMFRLFGFEVRADASWLIVAFLVAWSLASSLFPEAFPGMTLSIYWGMGVIGALLLFASVVAHEFMHSWVARRSGMTIKGITLFLFGGVAEMHDEPPNPRAEFLMAIAGPLTSLFLGGAFYGLTILAGRLSAPLPLLGVLAYLWPINLALAAFNLVPAFPLDGGRVLRAALWKLTGKLRRSTRIATLIGSGFAFLLMGFAVFSLWRGSLLNAVWWFLIGMFLHNASQGSYRQLIVREYLEGEPVARFLEQNPTTVSYHISVEQLVNEYVYRNPDDLFPVMQEDTLVGCVSAKEIESLPREQWERTTVKEISLACTPENTIPASADANEAFGLMRRTGRKRLLVVEGEHLVGIISLRDVLQRLSFQLRLRKSPPPHSA